MIDQKKEKWSVFKFIAGIVAYGILPTDVIPDFIPLLGVVDDTVVAVILTMIVIYKLRMISQGKKELMSAAQREKK